MKCIQLCTLVFLLTCFFNSRADDGIVGPYDKGTLTYIIGDSKFDFAFRLTLPEWFAAKNTFLLNNDNHEDRAFFIRHTIDTALHYGYGFNCYDHEIIQIHVTTRDRGVWGNEESIAMTTENTVKAYEVRFGDHKHGLPRHIWWIRELWMDFDIREVFGLSFKHNHFLTIGAFSFMLGRGIALGDAYAITPDVVLGFSPYDAVDQYAFGGKFYGDIIPVKLGYDFYGAILNNQADNFGNTGAKIRGQEIGKKFNQFRDFGVVNFVLAGKLRWRPVEKGETCAAYVEPYWLYNNDPEQKVEFLGDATSKLGTVGCMGEFAWNDVEFGFDMAFNLGRQKVKGVDRNIIDQDSKNGFVSVFNTAVDLVINPGQPNQVTRKLPYRVTVIDQKGDIIDVQERVNDVNESESSNGQVIIDDVTLDNVVVTGQTNPVPVRVVNGPRRFRKSYTNQYNGSMFIADACYWLYKRDFKVSGAFGFATGDSNPNLDLQFPFDSSVDGEYEGFIGLQEFYNGTRVRSAFFLSGAGRIPRLLDLPSENVNDRFASTVQRFTNIVFTGASLWYLPHDSPCKLDVNPNILFYWQEHATRRFDFKNLRDLSEVEKRHDPASTFLGIETNLFFNMEPVLDLRFFYKVSIFFPGKHYKEVRGRPISRTQAKFIDRPDRTGVQADREPTLGDDTAFATNFGLEYRF